MSEEVLWYAARVSGLMAWMLACGSLVAGLLLQAGRERRLSPAALWATDAQRLLGLGSLAFLLVHGMSVVLGPFGLSLADAAGGASVVRTGAVAGLLLIVAVPLLVIDVWLPVAARALAWLASVVSVAAGAHHAWSVGSDVRNPTALAVAALVGVAILAAAVLAAGADSALDGVLDGVTDAGIDGAGRRRHDGYRRTQRLGSDEFGGYGSIGRSDSPDGSIGSGRRDRARRQDQAAARAPRLRGAGPVARPPRRRGPAPEIAGARTVSGPEDGDDGQRWPQHPGPPTDGLGRLDRPDQRPR